MPAVYQMLRGHALHRTPTVAALPGRGMGARGLEAEGNAGMSRDPLPQRRGHRVRPPARRGRLHRRPVPDPLRPSVAHVVRQRERTAHVVLEHRSLPVAHRLHVQRRQVPPPVHHPSLRRPVQPCQHLDQPRLPRAAAGWPQRCSTRWDSQRGASPSGSFSPPTPTRPSRRAGCERSPTVGSPARGGRRRWRPPKRCHPR